MRRVAKALAADDPAHESEQQDDYDRREVERQITGPRQCAPHRREERFGQVVTDALYCAQVAVVANRNPAEDDPDNTNDQIDLDGRAEEFHVMSGTTRVREVAASLRVEPRHSMV